MKLSALGDFVARSRTDPGAPPTPDAAGWLPKYLHATSISEGWRLDEGFFRRLLEDGQCSILLDGLDEAPDRTVRAALSRLMESFSRAYGGCRIVVTSRPAGHTEDAVLAGFRQAQIEPLSDSAIETFLDRWCAALYAESPEAAREHCGELLSALRARVEIRRLARNPVMLTALAVVHWNERRLPEQRADLYQSILTWLARSREQRPGRPAAEKALALLAELALAMQSRPEGRAVEVSRRQAAEAMWCEDWYAADPYGGHLQKKPTRLAEETSRVLRGGSWFNAAWVCRSAFRSWFHPDDRGDITGFRVCVSRQSSA